CLKDGLTGQSSTVNSDRASAEQRIILGGGSKTRRQFVELAIGQEQASNIGNAEPRGSLDKGFKSQLKVERRTADNIQHIACRGLVFDGFPQCHCRSCLSGKSLIAINCALGELS